ncbi:HAD family hydrolase [Paenibacillus sp. VCA1]|uniref:HAD family hydrolase n=1 Tax=Paenibacillus sp. VCA1 TaxID=3039148 RepID=UPI002872557C|nr:HAD family hydrolase [Paenibacillus sp. VCA1]MDR9854802.1 HAD family hydrolase [Paenibacillus sp. VCA1]
MIKALIFDFDGLIVDTESPAYQAFCKIYGEYGRELPLELYARCVGTSFDAFNPYTHLAGLLGQEGDPERIRQQVDVCYRDLLKDVQPRPGVISYLQEARKLGLRVCIASSSYYNWIEPYLDRFNLHGYFDFINTADLVKKVKPDPELYLLSLQKLEVRPEEAVSFEDSLNGFNAAKSAGVRTVIVPNEMTATFKFEGYDLIIPDMEAMPLNELIRRLERQKRVEESE